MSRGFKKAFVFLLLVFFVCGCYPLKESAPESRYMPQINPYSEKSQGGKRAVTLYFPLKGELYLGTYQSEITVFIENGDTVSEAVMRALAADTDPSLNLDKVFTDTNKKLALTTTYYEIVLTLSKEILLGERNELSSISAEEAEQRRLTVYAIVNTLTEATGCRKVQILVDTDGDGRG
ncbi:MAG: GerMN domain-containing protein, partial [Clostridia bacterium]|nr:GerMN domain-containing protein [Clostridia bacterium]